MWSKSIWPLNCIAHNPVESFQYKNSLIPTPRDQVPMVLQDHISVQDPLSRVQSAFFLLSEVHSHNFEVHSFLKQDTHFCSAGHHFLPMFTKKEKFDKRKKEKLTAWKLSWLSKRFQSRCTGAFYVRLCGFWMLDLVLYKHLVYTWYSWTVVHE